MRRLRVCAILFASMCRAQAPDDATAILERARRVVAAQVARAANYSCVQTIERQYLVTQKRLPLGCAYEAKSSLTKPIMRDRLRLDVAVSEGREIYSWHSETKFTSTNVAEVVRTGPISSGNFVGFLQNILVDRGARFTYAGKSGKNGSETYNFSYTMPVAGSAYRVQARTGKIRIPFHGSFSIESADYQLSSLRVVGDSLPPDSPICSTETNITYQLVDISGHSSLVPAKFVLQLEDEDHVHTISSSDYSKCREFRGESTLHFEFDDVEASPARKQTRAETWLPAGIPLKIGLRTPIDDRTAYVGDAVEGVLLRSSKVPGTATDIPKGAMVEGVITKLEDHYQPLNFQMLSVKLNRLSWRGTSFLLNAEPKTSSHDSAVLRQLYGSPLPPFIADEDRSGLFVILSSHLHLDGRFSGEWITSSPSTVVGAPSSQ